MPMILSSQNVEKLIFSDKAAQALLPEYREIFKQWQFAIRGGLSHLSRKLLIEFIAKITPDQIHPLEEYWGTQVEIRKIDPSLIENIQSNLDNLEDVLNQADRFDNYCISRDGEQVYICFWR